MLDLFTADLFASHLNIHVPHNYALETWSSTSGSGCLTKSPGRFFWQAHARFSPDISSHPATSPGFQCRVSVAVWPSSGNWISVYYSIVEYRCLSGNFHGFLELLHQKLYRMYSESLISIVVEFFQVATFVKNTQLALLAHYWVFIFPCIETVECQVCWVRPLSQPLFN